MHLPESLFLSLSFVPHRYILHRTIAAMETTPAAQRVVTAAYILSVLSLFFLTLKLFTRYRIVRSLGWDDALVTLSFAVSVPLTVALHLEAKHGMGYKITDIPTTDLLIQIQWLWASTWIYVLSLGLSKLSILAQYLRIFIARRTVQAIWACIVFVGAYTFQSVIVGILSCNPPAKYWNPTIRGTCINYILYYYVAASLNIATDFAIILLPVPALRNLNVSRTKRIGVLFLFSIGGFGCVVSIIRLWTLYRLDLAVRAGDPSSANTLPALWSAIEIHVCIICACLPSLSPVLALVLRTIGLHASTHGGKSPSPMLSLSDSPHSRHWPRQHHRRGAYPGRRSSGGVFSTIVTGGGPRTENGSETGLARDEEMRMELRDGVRQGTKIQVDSRIEVQCKEDDIELKAVRTGSTPSENRRSDEIPISYLGR
ncbi:hypothetical protein B0J12DRAFT_663989 [Macrophomina phaseolina]|uniref:Rhodopsin domain-containing protein n=1 Tax=Macrophomina phaseolina TaxID=35725 RepID=A0ABQ8GB59_9PEZI|nr:hypothetical protein B0J12DRAFT_663989 [Macrophomina phaseolina]